MTMGIAALPWGVPKEKTQKSCPNVWDRLLTSRYRGFDLWLALRECLLDCRLALIDSLQSQ